MVSAWRGKHTSLLLTIYWAFLLLALLPQATERFYDKLISSFADSACHRGPSWRRPSPPSPTPSPPGTDHLGWPRFADPGKQVRLAARSPSAGDQLGRGILILQSLRYPILHAPKFCHLVHWFQNCFCFCSATFPSHVGTIFRLQWHFGCPNQNSKTTFLYKYPP